jgi:hypothetical protein
VLSTTYVDIEWLGNRSVVAPDKEYRFVAARLPKSAYPILMGWYRGGRLGIYGDLAAARAVLADAGSANQSPPSGAPVLSGEAGAA